MEYSGVGGKLIHEKKPVAKNLVTLSLESNRIINVFLYFSNLCNYRQTVVKNEFLILVKKMRQRFFFKHIRRKSKCAWFFLCCRARIRRSKKSLKHASIHVRMYLASSGQLM
jgi:hypothetical protein